MSEAFMPHPRLLTCLFAGWVAFMPAAHASQASSSFNVTVQLTSAPGSVDNPKTAASIPQRFVIFQSPKYGQSQASLDVYSGSGTITGWRLVTQGELEYIEMTLEW